jgi:hypothetical protein
MAWRTGIDFGMATRSFAANRVLEVIRENVPVVGAALTGSTEER